jgi:hypothetical protein
MRPLCLPLALAFVFVSTLLSRQVAQAHPSCDGILRTYGQPFARCSRPDRGRVDTSSFFTVVKADLCLLKRRQAYVVHPGEPAQPVDTYVVGGDVRGTYVADKVSQDYLLPGGGADSHFSPQDPMLMRLFMTKATALAGGARYDDGNVRADVADGVLRTEASLVDVRMPSYHAYRTTTVYDSRAKRLEIKYERDFSALPLWRKWKTLLHFTLECELAGPP